MPAHKYGLARLAAASFCAMLLLAQPAPGHGFGAILPGGHAEPCRDSPKGYMGEPCTVPSMRAWCNDTQWGASVRQACKKTCGCARHACDDAEFFNAVSAPKGSDGQWIYLKGTTRGSASDFTGCGQGPAKMYAIRVGPGETIEFGQSYNTFDSKYAVMWGTGRNCPTRFNNTASFQSCSSPFLNFNATNVTDIETCNTCKDDPDTGMMRFTNPRPHGSTARMLWYIIQGYRPSNQGSFNIKYRVTRYNLCRSAIDLGTATGRHSVHGSTDGKPLEPRLVEVSWSGGLVVWSANTARTSTVLFYLDVLPKQRVTIGISSDSFDSYHSLLWTENSTCPGGGGNTSSRGWGKGVDDPDNAMISTVNNGTSTRRLWFAVQGYSTSQHGAFTVTWNLEAPPVPAAACKDGADSGVMGRPCSDIGAYCKDPPFGKTLQTNCPVTCGVCTPSCKDRADSGVMGRPCSAIGAYCNQPMFGKTLQTNCPETCGKCSGGGGGH